MDIGKQLINMPRRKMAYSVRLKHDLAMAEQTGNVELIAIVNDKINNLKEYSKNYRNKKKDDNG